MTETPFAPAALGALLDLWPRVMPRDAPGLDRFRDIALLDRAFRPEGLVMLWRGARLIGFGYAVADGSQGWLVALGVARDERGQGHGRRILRSCLAFLAAAGCTSVDLGGRGERYLLPGADPVAYPEFRKLLLSAGFERTGETFAMACPLGPRPPGDGGGHPASGHPVSGHTFRHPGDGDIPELLRVAAGFGAGWSGIVRAHLARTGDTGNLWVACAGDGGIRGFAGFDLFPGCPGRFGPTGVLPAARGAGLGARLLRLSLDSMARRGHRSAWFLWGPESEPGRRMYASAGFSVSRTFEYFHCDLQSTASRGGCPAERLAGPDRREPGEEPR
ncbi:MAG TPA: GNAT family N-acetyltransferase [Trebonia sp.]|nr:GNAT family N-acetyltransferase [Trebonia sp.]